MALLFAAPAWLVFDDARESLAFTALAALIGMAPDADLVLMKYLFIEHHGLTHSLAFIVPAALVLGAVVVEPAGHERLRGRENGERRAAEAGEGRQWYLVHARAENTADRPVRLLLTLNFEGVRGDTVFHPGRNRSLPKKYVGGTVSAGTVREGDRDGQ